MAGSRVENLVVQKAAKWVHWMVGKMAALRVGTSEFHWVENLVVQKAEQ
jgi:hypothetical protein